MRLGRRGGAVVPVESLLEPGGFTHVPAQTSTPGDTLVAPSLGLKGLDLLELRPPSGQTPPSRSRCPRVRGGWSPPETLVSLAVGVATHSSLPTST